VNERDALLKAVCDNPDDDTPRLVFADWLQEHGDEDRAEFIRLQIELAALPEGKKKQKAQAREKELLDAHRDEWTEPLEEFEGSRTADYYEFRRGFVEAIGSDGEIMVEEGERVFELAPIRELVLADEEEYGALAKCEWLLRLHTLDLKGSGLSAHFDPAPLIRSKYLANLKSLCLAGEDDNGHLDEVGLRALAGTRYLTKLERLDISHNWLFGADRTMPEQTVARKTLWRLGEKMPALRELNLSGIVMRCGELSAMTFQPWVSQLRVLDLSRNQLAEHGCRALCDSKQLVNLERLGLTRNERYDATTGSLVPLSAAVRAMLKKRFGKKVEL
jgi:uncharacterized protein (TIGR02996 family)